MTASQLWDAYSQAHPDRAALPHEAWCFGSSMPDTLADLTASGVKTATASAYPFYPAENCPLPQPGDHSIILHTDQSAVCIIRVDRVTVVPFLEVTADHAWREGEGDRSLAFWRRVHADAFAEELKEINEAFTEDMLVVCEEFSVVWPT